MKNGTFKFLAELEENGDLRIEIEAQTSPVGALVALEKIDREVKRMRRDIFTKIENK
jgi:hypothetical protein